MEESVTTFSGALDAAFGLEEKGLETVFSPDPGLHRGRGL